MKKINESYKLIVFAALALALVLYIGNIWSGLQSLTSVFSPIILGGVLAFIFNVPMKKLEEFLDKCRVPQKLQRGLALVLEVLILVLIMTGIVIMSIFLMFAFLSSKEHLQTITSRLLQVLLPEKAVKRLSYVGSVIVETYDKFLMGQMIEAVIVGILVFIAYSLTGLPYAALTGVLAGVLSFIPYIGPFSACALGAIFIFTDSPWKALLSIAVFQVVQLIEGNIIYPRVVGQSVGLPTLFTLAAALIGGNLFGLVGMIFFTPIFAVIYRLVREFVVEKEEKKAEGSTSR